MLRLKTISLLGHPGELDTLPEGKLLINTINAHSYNTARKDATFAEALLKGDALIPDGASIVLAFKLLRHEKIERIAGWDLFQYEMKKLNAKGGTCFFLGSSEGTLQKIKAKAAGLYPNIRIETYSPPYKAEFSEEDNRRMIEAVNRVTPDLLWVGMTAPKQEKWAYAHSSSSPSRVVFRATALRKRLVPSTRAASWGTPLRMHLAPCSITRT